MPDMVKKVIAAVSGGVDSMAMLDMLVKNKQVAAVAHVNHGMRRDSAEDEALVRKVAAQQGLPFVSTSLYLSAETSEEVARNLRYAWLESVADTFGVAAIATAHHQDDIIETIAINIARGTSWRGICSLRSTTRRYRPLLQKSKADLVEYALSHSLEWREDTTNDTFLYLRNRIRYHLVMLDPKKRAALLAIYKAQCHLRERIENEVDESIGSSLSLDRHVLIMSDELVAIEILRSWIRIPLEQKRFRELLLFAKTAPIGAKWSLNKAEFVTAKKDRLVVHPPRD
jgi:tRNA(Ile)-lysidine synthase